MQNPLSPTTPATMPRFANVASFTFMSPPEHEFATGMGTTTVVNLRSHLRVDGMADLARFVR